MNENKLRLAIRKELRKINETPTAELVTQGFNAAAASPADIKFALDVIGAVLAGSVLLKAWSPIRSYIEGILYKRKA